MLNKFVVGRIWRCMGIQKNHKNGNILLLFSILLLNCHQREVESVFSHAHHIEEFLSMIKSSMRIQGQF